MAFCRDNPDAVERLDDGSVFHGSKLDGKPNGTGFVAIYEDDVVLGQDESASGHKLEQAYLGHFENGKS